MATPAKKIVQTAENRGFNEQESDALLQIDGCQNEIDELNEKSSEEIITIEQKYNTLRKPFYEKRNELIKGIRNFWVVTFINHPQISSILDEEEEECLRFMTLLDVVDFEDIKSGYRIHFHFNDNPYFENKELIKEFSLVENNGPRSVSTQIQWKEGKNLTKEMRVRQPQPSRRKRSLEFETFFDWFSDNSDPVNDEIAELIKDDIWPNPLQYYLVPDIELESEENDDSSDDDEEEVSPDAGFEEIDDDDEDNEDDDDVQEVNVDNNEDDAEDNDEENNGVVVDVGVDSPDGLNADDDENDVVLICL